MAENASNSHKRIWTRQDVFELIAMYQNYQMLWDVRCREFNNRVLKTNALETIAAHFDTTVDQVLKKVHNLRSQLAQELKKQATRKSKDGGVGYLSKWPYFKALSFLTPDVPSTSSDHTIQSMCDDTSIPVTFVGQPGNHIMLDAPVEMRHPENYEPSIEDHSNSELPSIHLESRKRCASEPTSEEVLLKAIRVLTEPEDEYQVFGRYIASELRGLYSDESRRHLKRAIQRAVLEASEMDDVLRINNQNDPLAHH